MEEETRPSRTSGGADRPRERDGGLPDGAGSRVAGHDHADRGDGGRREGRDPADAGARITDPGALMDLYYEISMEGVDLRRFLDRLDAGEWGPVDPEVVVEFLRQLEAVILSNIEVKATEGPHYAGRRDEVIAETQREFEELITRYLNRM
ncbi:MAG TPA: hypothetical protein VIL40_00545 [Thermaerobacter sp.]